MATGMLQSIQFIRVQVKSNNSKHDWT